MSESTMRPVDESGWSGTRRSDGAFITQQAVAYLVHAPPGKVFPAYGRMSEAQSVISGCPCCGRQFFTIQAAKLAANALLPVECDPTSSA